MQREKDVMERLDMDIATMIEEGEETVAEMEVQSMRTYIEPVSLLYKGVHEMEMIMSRNRGVEVQYISFILLK